MENPSSNVVRLAWSPPLHTEQTAVTSLPREDDITLTEPTKDRARHPTSADLGDPGDLGQGDPGDDDPTIARPAIRRDPARERAARGEAVPEAHGDDDPTLSRPALERATPRPCPRPRPNTSPPPPLLDSRYQLVAKIGEGSMGQVWEARQVSLDRAVAIKFLTHEEGGSRFKREAQAIAAIDHDGVVDVIDFGETAEGVPYFVMEMLRGQTLEALIHRQGPLPWPSVRRVALEITDALADCHARGVVHRDLKPSNVLLLDPPPIRGSSTKLIDFGIAKLLDEENLAKLTKPGFIHGTPAYMSPEQALGEAIDGRSDVYGLGCLLYYLLTGRRPFEHSSVTEALYNQVYAYPPPFAEAVPGLPIPAPVEAIVFEALAKKKAERFQSMERMRDALAAVPADANAETSMLGPSFAKYGRSRPQVSAIAEGILADKAKRSSGRNSSLAVNLSLAAAIMLLLGAMALLAWALLQ